MLKDLPLMKFSPFQKIIVNHAERYPWWVAPDLYKLMHQAAMGSGHAVASIERAGESLQEELAGLGEGPDEPLLDPITPDGVIVRVHLRPLVQKGLPPKVLLDAFLKTANQFRGDEHVLKKYIMESIELAERSRIHMRPHDLKRYLGLVSSAGFPAVHHSEEFNRVYRPAYRVVAREYLPEDWVLPDG